VNLFSIYLIKWRLKSVDFINSKFWSWLLRLRVSKSTLLDFRRLLITGSILFHFLCLSLLSTNHFVRFSLWIWERWLLLNNCILHILSSNFIQVNSQVVDCRFGINTVVGLASNFSRHNWAFLIDNSIEGGLFIGHLIEISSKSVDFISSLFSEWLFVTSHSESALGNWRSRLFVNLGLFSRWFSCDLC